MSDDSYASLIRSARRRPLWKAGASMRETAIGRDALERLLPHRGPMLMLDAITAIDLEQRSIRATRHIGIDDPGFVGHFPGEPVYPAFLQLEIGGQAGICLIDFLRRQSFEVPPDLRPRSVRPIKVHHGALLAEIHPGDSLTALATVLVDDELTSIFAAQMLKGDVICSTAIVEVCFVGS
jgi:3-hydroxymyristoyl/3-hydroxydecanoyl-(acyl carrier protein) dehydratase